MYSHRRVRAGSAVVLSLVMVAGTVVLSRPARARVAAATPTSADAPDAGLHGTAATGTGVLPSFVRAGSTLIRLEVGAFDPLSDPLPAQNAIPAIAEGALGLTQPVYWLVQVRDLRFAEASAAIAAAGCGGSSG